MHETAEVVLPRFSRRSRLYEATAKNLLRIAIELVGDVEREAPAGEPDAGELLKRKTAGNVIELGSIAAFGFSPLWLLAAASDISHGSRVYLDVLVAELKRAGVLAEDAELGSIDDLLGGARRCLGTTARLVDLPPLELVRVALPPCPSCGRARQSCRRHGSSRALHGLQRTAAASGSRCSRSRPGWVSPSSSRPVRRSGAHGRAVPGGLAAAPRGGFRSLRPPGRGPYRAAMSRHFDPERETWTERAKNRVRR